MEKKIRWKQKIHPAIRRSNGENDEIAEKEPHEEEQVTANDIYTDAGVDKELLEEVRKKVQELLHGVKASQRVEAEQQEYPDFNRKYDINKSRQTDEQEEMPEPEEIEKPKVEKHQLWKRRKNRESF